MLTVIWYWVNPLANPLGWGELAEAPISVTVNPAERSVVDFTP